MSGLNLNRRRFIQGLGAVGAAPLILPSSIWSSQQAPSKTLTTGLIGFGRMGSGLLGGFLSRTRVLAVCDVDTTRRNAAKQRTDGHYQNTDCAAYSDFRELLDREDIDLAIIATPDHWHASQSIAAMRAGKDVYCEKPLTHNIHEAIELMKVAAETKRIVQTGSQQRSSREFRAASELVRNGVLGKITHVDCRFGAAAVPCDLHEEEMEPGLDWDLWLGPAPLRPYNAVLSPRGIHNHFPRWRDYREFGGGSVADLGAHHLDIVQWALGRDDSGPVEVATVSDPEATHGAELRYADGVRVIHSPGFDIHFHGEQGDIYVARGQFRMNHEGNPIAADQGSAGARAKTAVNLFLKEGAVRLEHSGNHQVNFLQCVRSRKRPITDEIVGGRTAICCHLLNLSYYHRASIKWQPERMAFAPGSGDPGWLTRDYRAPWAV